MRSELLRSKTTQVSADHNREVRALGAIRERAKRVDDRVRSQEDQFWREISRIARAQSGALGANARQADVTLGRALEAHKLLSLIKDEQKGISKEVTVGIARVISSKVALSAFKKLERQELVRHQVRMLERYGEEVGELAVSALGRVRRGAAPIGEKIANDDTSPAISRGAPLLPHVVPLREPVVEPPPLSTPVSPLRELSIHSAGVSGDARSATLCVQVESRGVPVVCSLSSKPRGEIVVVVETPHQGIVDKVEVERVALTSKLSSLGIRIGRLDIKRGENMRDVDAGPLPRRRRSREERDENVIA